MCRPVMVGLLALCCCIEISGCRDKTSGPEAAPTPSRADDASIPQALVGSARVELLDSGAEPYVKLRYRLSIGDIQTVGLSLKYDAINRLRAVAPARLDFPTIRLTFVVEVLQALEGDRVRYSFELSEAGLDKAKDADGALVAMAGVALKASQGLHGTAVVNSLGIISDANHQLKKNSPEMAVMVESMQTSMEQISVPLPIEPVGLGARWQARNTLVQGGVTLDQTTTYELAANAHGELEIRSTIEQVAGHQLVEMADVSTANLISLGGKGHARIELNLARLAPLKARYKISSESKFEFVSAGRRRVLTSSGQLALEIDSE